MPGIEAERWRATLLKTITHEARQRHKETQELQRDMRETMRTLNQVHRILLPGSRAARERWQKATGALEKLREQSTRQQESKAPEQLGAALTPCLLYTSPSPRDS